MRLGSFLLTEKGLVLRDADLPSYDTGRAALLDLLLDRRGTHSSTCHVGHVDGADDNVTERPVCPGPASPVVYQGNRRVDVGRRQATHARVY